MIAVSQLGKNYGAQILFENVNMRFHPGQCYGIVGANGSGKSTFLNILCGEEEVSLGECIIPGNCRLGFLRQNRFRDLQQAIIDVAMFGDEEVFAALQERDEILAAAESGDFKAERYARLEEIIEHGDGYTLESRAAEILEGLGVPAHHHKEPLSVLSGGFQLRVLLAQAMTGRPDVLLLDEPTNHLDIISIRWLEKFIANFAGTVLVVSHDHRFLDTVCTTILDVDYDTVLAYPGNYTKFVDSKVAERERREKEISKQEKYIAEQEAFIARFKAKATKARQAQSKKKQLDKIIVDRVPVTSRRYPRFKFAQKRPSGKEVLRIESLSKSFAEKRVLTDVNLLLRRGDRLAVIGPNGIGKSTLLKIVMEKIGADMGKFEWGHEVALGYFPQDHHEELTSAEQSALDYVWSARPSAPTGEIRGLLGRSLFSGEEVNKKLGQLSGGEAARLIFAKMMGDEPNVLVLDEPTNHLDLESIDALLESLKGFEGTIIFVSHDRYFVSALSTRILELRIDGMSLYEGNYDDYLEQCGDDHLDAGAILKKQREQERQEVKEKSTPKKDKPKKVNRQKLEKELRVVTKDIEEAELEVSTIHENWSNPEFFFSHSQVEIEEMQEREKALQAQLLEWMGRWEELEDALGGKD